MQDGGGLDRSSTQGGSGAQPRRSSMTRRTLTLGRSYSRITKRPSLSWASYRHGRTQTTVSNRCLIPTKVTSPTICPTIRIRARAWALGTRPRAKTRRKRKRTTSSLQVKAWSVIGYLDARHRRAARAVAAQRSILSHPARHRQWEAATRFHAKRRQSTFRA